MLFATPAKQLNESQGNGKWVSFAAVAKFQLQVSTEKRCICLEYPVDATQ